MDICQHGYIMGRCPRCDREVAELMARGGPREPDDLNLNRSQRRDLDTLLLARLAKADNTPKGAR